MWKSILGAAALLGVVVSGGAQGATIVPVGSAYVEGSTNNVFPFATNVIEQYQQVWDGNLFGSETIDITAISFRLDEGLPSFGPTLLNQSLSLSTTSRLVDGLSTNLASNIGADNTVVATNPTVSGTGGAGPNPFDITIVFDQAFSFDPTAGNLLLNVVGTGVHGIGAFDAINDNNDGTSRVYTRGGLIGPGFNTTGLVVQFSSPNYNPPASLAPVPVPAALPLLVTALGGFGFFSWRRRRNAA